MSIINIFLLHRQVLEKVVFGFGRGLSNVSSANDLYKLGMVENNSPTMKKNQYSPRHAILSEFDASITVASEAPSLLIT